MREDSTGAEAQAWDRWHNERDDRARTWLIEHFAPLVEEGLRSFRNVRRQDQDDLRGAGYLGLVQSVDQWNPEKMSWRPFASFRIRAAMVDHVRRSNWIGKSFRQTVRKLEGAEDVLTAKLNGRPPTDEELAAHLGLDGVDALAALRSKVQGTDWIVGSLDVASDEGERNWEEALPDPTSDVEGEADRRRQAATLRSILARLPARQRQILEWKFFGGLNQKQIARELGGLHESRVSQVVQEALSAARLLAYEQPLMLTEEAPCA